MAQLAATEELRPPNGCGSFPFCRAERVPGGRFCAVHQPIMDRVRSEIEKTGKPGKIRKPVVASIAVTHVASGPERLARLLSERPELSRAEQAAELNTSERTATRWLKQAREQGLAPGGPTRPLTAAERDQAVKDAAEFVNTHGLVSRAQLEEHLGVTRGQLTGIAQLAAERGLIESRRGIGGGYVAAGSEA